MSSLILLPMWVNKFFSLRSEGSAGSGPATAHFLSRQKVSKKLAPAMPSAYGGSRCHRLKNGKRKNSLRSDSFRFFIHFSSRTIGWPRRGKCRTPRLRHRAGFYSLRVVSFFDPSLAGAFILSSLRRQGPSVVLCTSPYSAHPE